MKEDTMSSIFKKVTTSAIENILNEHCTKSKYGYFISDDKYRSLIANFCEFMETSRNIRAKGENMLSGSTPPAVPKKKPREIKNFPSNPDRHY